MFEKQMINKNLALLICICIIVTSSFGIEFIISHSNHDCIGNNCSVCHQIQSVCSVLKQINICLCSIFIIKIMHAFYLLCKLALIQLNLADITLVRLKVRLDN